MKRLHFITISLTSIALAIAIPNAKYEVNAETNYVIETNGCSQGTIPNYLDLNKCNEDEIRAYYSSISSLSSEKRSGTEVLQYLKTILYEMNYFTYTQIGNIYSITDRDWTNSPTLSSGTYDPQTNTVTSFSLSDEATSNPYINMLYVDYTVETKTPLKNEQGNANFDKEHVWCQSRGFKASSGAKGPAGTDLHHLISGDSYVNQTVHNNNPYGFVSAQSGQGNKDSTTKNKKGTPVHTSSSDECNTVFEPADEWKGDIARSIFYMVARYNNIANSTGVISQFEPNLAVVNYLTSNGNAISSSDTVPATMGIISDLLAWNKLDPVSEFEIYRNDLVYRNFQGNRNPFIDFPQWIDAIWGTANEDGSNYNPTPVGKLDPQNDAINGKTENVLSLSASSITLEVGKTASIKATTTSTNNIIWTVGDASVISLNKYTSTNNENITIAALKEGKSLLTAKVIKDETEYTKSIWITVTAKPAKENNLITIVSIVVGVIVVIFSFVTILVKKSHKKKRR